MKKFLFAILACTIALGFTSCREKKAKDKVKDRVENVKESVEDALEEAQEQIEEGADNERYLLRRERLHRILDILGFLPFHFAQDLDT